MEVSEVDVEVFNWVLEFLGGVPLLFFLKQFNDLCGDRVAIKNLLVVSFVLVDRIERLLAVPIQWNCLAVVLASGQVLAKRGCLLVQRV